MHYGNSLSSFLIHYFHFFLGSRRDQATATLTEGGASLWGLGALARIACSTLLFRFRSFEAYANYSMYFRFYVYVLCSFSCMFNRLLVLFTSGSSTHADQLSVLVVVLKFSQCMCVSVFTLNTNTIKYNSCCIHIGKYNNPIIIIMIIREKNSFCQFRFLS